MDDLDLDINNYELNDILNLFKIPSNFTEDHLKQCKKAVLKTHPDKSGLDKEVFLFFSKAYKILFQIHTFKNRSESNETDYNSVEKPKNTKDSNGVLKFSKDKNFNKKFNELFEKHFQNNEHNQTGYGDFLKSEVDQNIKDLSEGKISQVDRNKYLESIRENSRALVVHQEVKETSEFSNFTNLGMSAPTSYSSEIFSNLPYEDLKKAHTETLIPVTKEDARKDFSSIDKYKQHRESNTFKPASLQQAKRFLAEKEQQDSSSSTSRAYLLAKQAEEAKNMQKAFDSHFLRIKN
tara:strand:- start:239 stop:1117 length:879 start_codon:yes stop_codon:yes gene_type:complete